MSFQAAVLAHRQLSRALFCLSRLPSHLTCRASCITVQYFLLILPHSVLAEPLTAERMLMNSSKRVHLSSSPMASFTLAPSSVRAHAAGTAHVCECKFPTKNNFTAGQMLFQKSILCERARIPRLPERKHHHSPNRHQLAAMIRILTHHHKICCCDVCRA